MEFDADLNACAALVEKGDPERFRQAMVAPLPMRVRLFPLYAFNVEVSRAPWVTQEPMIAEMRLQWWRDVCAEITSGGPVRRHEVATPLARAIGPDQARLLDELVAARRWDIYRDAFEDEVHFDAYMDQTSGHLMVAAAMGEGDEQVLRQAAYALAVAQWLCAVPELEARGRVPLLEGTADGITALAEKGLEKLFAARRGRSRIPKHLTPLMLGLTRAEQILRAVRSSPALIANDAVPEPNLKVRIGFTYAALSGRW